MIESILKMPETVQDLSDHGIPLWITITVLAMSGFCLPPLIGTRLADSISPTFRGFL